MNLERPAHVKARTEKPGIYPERFQVPEDKVAWDTDFSEYEPKYFVAPVVLDNSREEKEGGWAEPEIFNPLKAVLSSYEGNIQFDKAGLPMNPHGRTGISGRGLLGKWGANFAADPIITRRNSQTGNVEMLAIRRKDNGQWAIPGGMVEYGDSVTKTLAKELEEEAGVSLDWRNARKVYEGYVDDPRNTDNAWMETSVAHIHLEPEVADKLKVEAGSDASAVKWEPVTEEFLNSMYASHGKFVRMALHG